jgi:hypothetical protein
MVHVIGKLLHQAEGVGIVVYHVAVIVALNLPVPVGNQGFFLFRLPI